MAVRRSTPRGDYKVGNLIIENAKIMFKNFSGSETPYNRSGDRNFCVIIEDPLDAQQLAEDGWNVKILQPKEPGDEALHYIKVSVSYRSVPPSVFMVTKKRKTPLFEDTIGQLDVAYIKNVDLTIAPYEWDVNGKSGTKAYLKTMYAVIEEDDFAAKYDSLLNSDEEW